MQRRNFRMPSKNHRQKFPAGNTAGKDGKQQYGRPAPAPRPAKPAPKDSPPPKSPPPNQPDDKGRWQDDGGEAG